MLSLAVYEAFSSRKERIYMRDFLEQEIREKMGLKVGKADALGNEMIASSRSLGGATTQLSKTKPRKPPALTRGRGGRTKSRGRGRGGKNKRGKRGAAISPQGKGKPKRTVSKEDSREKELRIKRRRSRSPSRKRKRRHMSATRSRSEVRA